VDQQVAGQSRYRILCRGRKAGSSLADFLLVSSTLKMETIRSSEKPLNIISTRRHIPEDCFLHSHRRENLKSYIQTLKRSLWPLSISLIFSTYVMRIHLQLKTRRKENKKKLKGERGEI
jgi:hypothetical protein